MQSSPPRDLPEQACASFERGTGWDLCVHDQTHLLWQFLPPSRFAHLRPPCTLVKRQRQDLCAAFDGEQAAAAAQRVPGGVVKRCHAGLVEVAVAVGFQGAPWLTLFAGVRRPAPGLAVELAAEAPLAGPWSRAVAALPAATGDELRDLAELLHQLGSRLVQWRTLALPVLVAPAADPGRRERIHDWILRHHRGPLRLAQLAGELGLSEDRASHAVIEACGQGFAALVTTERLRSATDLLRRSDLSMAEVAEACGFGDRTRFHKVFTRALGLSPARWRRQANA